MPDRTRAARRQFGGAAAAYANSALHAAGPDLALLKEASDLGGSEQVLDLGCGPGHATFALAPLAARVVGVDVTPEMVGAAQRLAGQRSIRNATFAEADVASLPFAEASFDLVVSRLAGHHFAEAGRALSEAGRVLRTGGRILFADTVAPEDPGLDTFCNTFEFLRDPSHTRCHRASEWVRMLRGVGFDARVTHRIAIAVDGAAWAARARTPPARLETVRELFRAATPAQRSAFDIRDEPWGFSQPVVIIAGTWSPTLPR